MCVAVPLSSGFFGSPGGWEVAGQAAAFQACADEWSSLMVTEFVHIDDGLQVTAAKSVGLVN